MIVQISQDSIIRKYEMATISVDLPDHLKSYVEEKAKQAGFSSAGDYLVALIIAASQKQDNLEQALMAGLSSGPAEPWTDDEWREIKDRVVSHGSE
jgi:Arc/MetJ-type ribon-helix-helix transcriptional regulator